MLPALDGNEVDRTYDDGAGKLIVDVDSSGGVKVSNVYERDLDGFAKVKNVTELVANIFTVAEKIAAKASTEWDDKAVVKKMFGRLLTGIPGEKRDGRGGIDMKTNDVLRLIPEDKVVIRLELNRPGGGFTFGDLEYIRLELKKIGWNANISPRHERVLAENNLEHFYKEQILCAHLEFIVKPELVSALIKQGADLITKRGLWVSVNAACNWKVAGKFKSLLESDGIKDEPVAKHNLGFGRRLS